MSSLPLYAREKQREWRRYDRWLRLRRSLDEYGAYILERKTRYLYQPPFRPASKDRCVQLNDDYRKVILFWPNEIQLIGDFLRRTDVQRLGGASVVSRLADEQDERLEALIDRKRISDLEAASGEAYEHLAWLERRRISMAGAYN